MSVADQLVRIDRADTARWIACFVVAVAAHGVAALTLLPSTEASDFDAGAPVVMLELPEVAGAPSTPQSDLDPGPETESDPTPQPKEETKPIEQQAEVALPIPEPPKPEPPVEEQPPTAPRSVETPPSVLGRPTPGVAVRTPRAIMRWNSAFATHLERFKRYPAAARSRHEQGVATVAFVIDREGRLLNSHIVHSSGSSLLDDETLAMLARAQPMPRPPGDVPDSALSFIVPVRFNIR
jgi:protein TonB